MSPDTTSLSLDDGVLARLLTAAVLGALVGVEREASDQPAGLRTHIAVALGAALFGVISTLGFVEFDGRRANSLLQADVTRVASNVVVGIGFLGAGVIFRQGSTIKNLTTAASLWTVAAIGLACGVGDLGTAGIATVVLILSLVALRPIRSFIRDRLGDSAEQVRIEMEPGADTGELLSALERRGEVGIDVVRIERGNSGTVVTVMVRAGGRAEVHQLMAAASSAPGVDTVTQS